MQLGSFTNDTSFTGSNETLAADEGISTSVWTNSFGWISVTWILVSNILIISTFVINAGTTWPVFSRFVLSLSMCDLIVGILYVPMLVNYSVYSVTNFYGCVILFYLLFIGQIASLYHIFGICVHRTVKFIFHPNNRTVPERRAVIIISCCSWIIAAVVALVPNIILTKSYTVLNSCSQEDIYTRDFRFTGILATFYVIPYVLTNVFYLFACVRLKRAIKRVVVPNERTTNTGDHAQENDASNDRRNNATHVGVERKVMGTVGVLLVIFNILTLPTIITVVYETRVGSLPYNVRKIAATLLTLNSGFNPLVYALRSTWIRGSIKSILKDMGNELRRLCCRCFSTSNEHT